MKTNTAFAIWGFAALAIFLPPAVSAEEVLTWKDCVSETLKHHPDLVSSKAKLNQSKADKTAAVSVILPQAQGNINADTAQSAPSANVVASSRGGKPFNTYSYSVSGTQLVFDAFKSINDIEKAVKNIDAAAYNYAVTSSNVRLRLKTAFVELLKANRLLHLTEVIAERRKQNEDLIRLRYQAGREHKGSLMTAQADLAQALFEVGQAKRQIDLAKRQLSKELGRTHLFAFEIQGELESIRFDRERPDFEHLAENVPLLRALVVQKEAARYGVRSAVAGFFPNVYASGQMGKKDSIWAPRHADWSAGVTLTWPFLEGGNVIAQLDKSKSVLRQAEADEKSGRDGVILTLEQTWNDYQDAIEQIGVQEMFMNASRERARIAEQEYSTGLVTFNDWIIIEDNLVRDEKAYLNAQANALLSEANWAQAKGLTLDEE